MLTHRRGSPLLMGVRSDHKLSTDHIPVLYRSCEFNSQPFCVICCLVTATIMCFSFFLAAKDKKGCSALPRTGQDTCLFPVDEKAVEYYFASDAR